MVSLECRTGAGFPNGGFCNGIQMACRDPRFDKGLKLFLDGKDDLTTGANVLNLLHALSVDHGQSPLSVGRTDYENKPAVLCQVRLLLFGIVYILIKNNYINIIIY